MPKVITRPLIRSALLVLPALFLAAPGAQAAPRVEVTRFHQAEVARSGAVQLVAEEGIDAASLEYRTFASAVAAALTRAGFTPTDDAAVPVTARIGYERHVERPADRRGSPVSVGVGGSTGGYRSGVGVGIGINLSGKPKAMIVTGLRVQLRGADGATFWEGRAETAAKENKPEAQPGAAAGLLADALFRDFPGTSGETITVK